MNGILNINKAYGMTSFEVVAAVKRLTGERHTGHAGTLDPAATGVLPVCLGKSTRTVEYLMDATKTYQAAIELGRSTDTYDAVGRTVKNGDAATVTLDRIMAMLPEFQGDIMQVPPVYSALKQNGKPLYSYARAGVSIIQKSRPVTVHRIEVRDWQPPVIILKIVCGKGTYIRSIANDLGERLGCGAYLKSLVRMRCGPFDINDSITLAQLEEAINRGDWESLLYPVDTVISHWRAIVLDGDTCAKVINGEDLTLPSSTGTKPSDNYCRAYSAGGLLIAVLHYHPETEKWHPEKVFI